jgi:hypothetical protein
MLASMSREALPDPTPAGLAAAGELAGRVAGTVDWRPLTRWISRQAAGREAA